VEQYMLEPLVTACFVPSNADGYSTLIGLAENFLAGGDSFIPKWLNRSDKVSGLID
jgi:hypothetical protein